MKPSPNNIPTIFTIFGATGDLMQKKIVPSLFFLHKQKLLPEKLRIFGFARRDLDDAAFRTFVFEILQEKKVVKTRTKSVEHFLTHFSYIQGTFANKKGYRNLKLSIEAQEKKWQVCANKLMYLAVPPDFVKIIVNKLESVYLHKACGGDAGWTRILIEKPFGSDTKSAALLEKTFTHWKDEQVYRLDHYLGKEMVQSILNFRFSNNLFEDSWDNEQIERIDMKLWEDIGVEDRGNFYDNVGALRDVGQNHLLSILSILTMEHPADYTAKFIQTSRASVLQELSRMTQDKVIAQTFRAQYRGYKKISGVKENSQTETYFKIKTHINTPRWRGVPIYIESGKRMGTVKKEIVITFKHKEPCICPPSGPVQNRVIISLHPRQEMKIEFFAQEPGFDNNVEKREFVFSLYKRKSKLPYVEEYAKLFYDAFLGDQTWFLSKSEIAAEWRMVDTILNTWQKNSVPLHTYKPETPSVSQQADTYLAAQTHDIPHHIGIIGLGRMGGRLAENIIDSGWIVTGYNRTSAVTKTFEKKGLDAAYSHKELIEKLPTPRIVWLMVPHGKPVDDTLFGKDGLVEYLEKGDIVIDGGNSQYKNSIARAKKLKKKGIHMLDVGVSGGPAAARQGACIMIGGDKKIFDYTEPLFAALAQTNGYEFFPGHGAGHFVKMVHNGIEYGMMQAIAEGFNIMKTSKYKLDLSRVASVYNNGSIIESHLIAWLYDALREYGVDLKKIDGHVADSGEGQWTVDTAHEMGAAVRVIEEALLFRRRSQKNASYTGKIVSALRGQFGMHPVIKKRIKK